MPELRTDWLLGRSVIIAENRSARPNEFACEVVRAATEREDDAFAAGCPFCPGQESQTPPAVYERLDAAGRWQVRVVPNKYPAVAILPLPLGEGRGEGDANPPLGSVLRGEETAVGVHEVIIESSRHVRRTAALSVTELGGVLETYSQRLAHWRDDGRFPYALVFKNQGPRAGASLAHLHSQLVALSEVPPLVDAELRRAAQLYRPHRECPYCRLLADERSCGERIVLERDGYIAFCPYASLQPYEVWLLPSAHEPSFELPTRPQAFDWLAGTLLAVLGRVEAIVPEAAYNLMLRTTPWQEGCDGHGHWRIEVLPRLATYAGLEMTTGVYINQLSPEHAARQLRTS